MDIGGTGGRGFVRAKAMRAVLGSSYRVTLPCGWRGVSYFFFPPSFPPLNVFLSFPSRLRSTRLGYPGVLIGGP